MPAYLPRIAILLPAVLIAVLLVFAAQPREATGATFTVTTDASLGAGSLREAIVNANGSAGFDTIDFDTGAFPVGNPATIMPSTPLPPSTDPAGLEIDGTGAGVIIDGSAAPAGSRGLEFHTSPGVDLTDVQVRSITVQNFPDQGIAVCGGASGACADDVSNTEIAGVEVAGNGGEGITVFGANITGTDLSNCTSSDNDDAGVLLSATQQLTATDITDCELTGNGTQAIQFRGVTGISDTSVGRVSASNNPNDGLWMRSPSGSVTGTSITHYDASNVATGLHFDAGVGVSDADVSDATLNDNATGMKVEGDSGDITSATFTGIQTSRSISHGMLFEAGGAMSDVALTNCTSDDNGDKGIEVNIEMGVNDFAISDCQTSGNTAHGINVRPGSTGDIVDMSLQDAEANDNGSYGINPNTEGSDLIRLTMTNVEASGNAFDGVYANGAGGDIIDAMISGLAASDNGSDGLDLATSGNITGSSVSEGTFTGNGSSGLEIDGPTTVSFNRIYDNTDEGVNGAGPGTVIGEHNWWGCNEGPTDADCDSATGDVSFDPWLILSIAADPDPAIEGQPGSVLGAVTMSSASAGSPMGMSIPDGTVIDFSADLGFVEADAPTVNGIAEASYTADEPGTANVTAMLDAESVTVPLEVLEAGSEVVWGDSDCDSDTDPDDALPIILHAAELDTDGGGCLALGTPVELVEAAVSVAGGLIAWGDVDCSGEITADDAVDVLRFNADLDVHQPQGCPEIGEPVQVVVPD